MKTTHAEHAVLAYVIAGIPKGAAFKIRHEGMPDFNVSAVETALAIDSLRLRGVLLKHGPHYKLTDAGLALMQPIINQLQQLAA